MQDEYDPFEKELLRHRPAAAPSELMAKLTVARPRSRPVLRHAEPVKSFWPLLRQWLIPATAVVVAGVLLWRFYPGTNSDKRTAEAAPVKADEVQIDRELVASFDTVARLPGGEPVRFRCREWLDEVTVSDKERGLVIERRMPRLEVVPVRFETY